MSEARNGMDEAGPRAGDTPGASVPATRATASPSDRSAIPFEPREDPGERDWIAFFETFEANRLALLAQEEIDLTEGRLWRFIEM